MTDEPEAMRYDFDGFGYRYIDSGSGSDWRTRHPDAEPLYAQPQTDALKKAREDAMEDALNERLTDIEIEDALISEDISTWGPAAERFERMFAVVMKLRAAKGQSK